MEREYLVGVTVAVALVGGGVMAALSIDGGATTRAQPTPVADAPAAAYTRTAPPALPVMPDIDRDRVADAYARAVMAGSETPGMAAFRSHTDAFVDHNRPLVADKARAEGLTPREIGELTAFALLARQSQNWPVVEMLVGHPIDDGIRDLVAGLVRGDSEEMKMSLREHVAAGDGADARWQTIERIEQHYLDEYYALTGMDATKLDSLLAGAVLGEEVGGVASAPEAPTTIDGEVIDAAQTAVARDKRIVVIDRVVAPTGAARQELERQARGNPRFAAELSRDVAP